MTLGRELMSYLKIFPRSIIAERDEEDGYVGRMQYDFEQYGRMLYDHETDISLVCRSFTDLDWLIVAHDLKSQLSGFERFIQSLNHYLFEVVKFDPLAHWSKPSGTYYLYHFEPVYFDVGLRQFISSKS